MALIPNNNRLSNKIEPTQKKDRVKKGAKQTKLSKNLKEKMALKDLAATPNSTEQCFSLYENGEKEDNFFGPRGLFDYVQDEQKPYDDFKVAATRSFDALEQMKSIDEGNTPVELKVQSQFGQKLEITNASLRTKDPGSMLDSTMVYDLYLNAPGQRTPKPVDKDYSKNDMTVTRDAQNYYVNISTRPGGHVSMEASKYLHAVFAPSQLKHIQEPSGKSGGHDLARFIVDALVNNTRSNTYSHLLNSIIRNESVMIVEIGSKFLSVSNQYQKMWKKFVMSHLSGYHPPGL